MKLCISANVIVGGHKSVTPLSTAHWYPSSSVNCRRVFITLSALILGACIVPKTITLMAMLTLHKFHKLVCTRTHTHNDISGSDSVILPESRTSTVLSTDSPAQHISFITSTKISMYTKLALIRIQDGDSSPLQGKAFIILPNDFSAILWHVATSWESEWIPDSRRMNPMNVQYDL